MTPHPVAAADTTAQARLDRSRVLRAFNVSLAAVLLLVAVFTAQGMFDWRAWAVAPLQADGLRGILTAPLLHGSLAHLGANAAALLILGTLAGSVYPRATVMALPLLWLGSGLGAWLLGEPGSRHLGASGVTHGLMFLVFVLGLLRLRDPQQAKPRYSWEDEDEDAAWEVSNPEHAMLEPPPPRQVPVLWQRQDDGSQSVVLHFPPRERPPGA